MNQEWSLDVLYHGYEDPKFDKDMKKFESEVAGMKEKIEAAKKTRPSKGTGNMSYGKRRNGSIRKSSW